MTFTQWRFSPCPSPMASAKTWALYTFSPLRRQITTLGVLLDSQLNLQSRTFNFAIWSHKEALYTWGKQLHILSETSPPSARVTAMRYMQEQNCKTKLHQNIFGGAASQYKGLSVRLSACLCACLPVPVSFLRGFSDDTNIQAGAELCQAQVKLEVNYSWSFIWSEELKL